MATILMIGTEMAFPANPPSTNAPATEMLLNAPLGNLVVVPTNAMPPQLLPPARTGISNQIPTTARGTQVPQSVQQRQQDQRGGHDKLKFFPPFAPPLAPYLAPLDEKGNTALQPGALIRSTPADVYAQRAKYWASEIGLRYSLKQSFTYVNMTDVMQGDNTLGYYTLGFGAKWAVYSDPPSSTAGWLSSEIKVKTGLGESGDTQSAQSNLGTLTSPTGLWSGLNGIGIQELAWQQSFCDGELVFLGGVINQGNYLDANTYANSGHGQLLNSALINSMVMPLPAYQFGANLQWQFDDEWYVIAGASVGTASAGQAPWTDFDWNNWSVIAEFGYAPKDFLGLGPGVYRVQPFLAQATGAWQTNYTVTIPGTTNTTDVTLDFPTQSPVQGGLCFNFQQQLGRDAPVGWFGRFGFGGSQVSAGASAQIGTGFVMRGPLAHLGLFHSRSGDGAAVGFVWSRPSASSTVPAHENEFVLEAGYGFQITPLAKIQPDFQVVWNPAYNPDTPRAFVFQIQVDLAW